MDTTPNSAKTRDVLKILPSVRDDWIVPAQRQWAQRIRGIITKDNPNLTSIIDAVIERTTRSVEMELGIQPGSPEVTLSREEWEQATRAIGHAAGVIAVYAVAEAGHEINSLEQAMTHPSL